MQQSAVLPEPSKTPRSKFETFAVAYSFLVLGLLIGAVSIRYCSIQELEGKDTAYETALFMHGIEWNPVLWRPINLPRTKLATDKAAPTTAPVPIPPPPPPPLDPPMEQ